jgi:hypothetical protein
MVGVRKSLCDKMISTIVAWPVFIYKQLLFKRNLIFMLIIKKVVFDSKIFCSDLIL